MTVVSDKPEVDTPARSGLPHLLRRGRLGRPLWRGGGVLGIILLLWAGYVFTGQPVTLIINDRSYPVRVHRLTVAGVLQEVGLSLEAEDRVHPAPGARLSPGDTITIQLARPVTVEADGHSTRLFTHQQTVAGVLAEAGLALNPHDDVLMDGVKTSSPQILLPPPVPPPNRQKAALFLFAADTPQEAPAATRPEAVQLIVHRAVPVTLNDGRVRSTFYTTQPNVGEALLEQNITLFLGDKVTPGLGTRLLPGMEVYIQRSIPVVITVDGWTVKTRTRRQTVGQVLAQEQIVLMGQDFSRPPADYSLAANEFIEVVRVREAIEIEQELIPFEAKWIPDPQMELDRQEVQQTGTNGSIKKRSRIRYENGQEVWRVLEDEWLDQEPQERVIAYGTNIVIRTLDTPDGPLEYWRKISMLATAYSAATSGKDRDHPRYGITRSGLPAGYGIVAVDPKVIPLMADLYVPGYGPALAGDTGGKVLGKHIDLGYDEDQSLPDLYEWREVYVLTPVPPPDKIRYVLPQWPQQQ
ncbi:MAG: DUF348 domain-containing protein [Anaerolineae bacterium]|nr:DUF348 domain-containing protein [Anaerolineae bacterium]